MLSRYVGGTETLGRFGKGRIVAVKGEACTKTGCQVHARCLMSNHFHLVVETPKGNLVARIKCLPGTYTSRLNRRHKLFGHRFSGRCKALIVNGDDPFAAILILAERRFVIGLNRSQGPDASNFTAS